MSYIPERRHLRFDFSQLPLVLSLRLPEPAVADKPFRLDAKNLSLGGMKFLCNRRFTLFESLNLSFYEKTGGKALPNLEGKVVRVEEIDTGFGERTYGIAVAFVSGAEALTAHLPAGAEKSSGK